MRSLPLLSALRSRSNKIYGIVNEWTCMLINKNIRDRPVHHRRSRNRCVVTVAIAFKGSRTLIEPPTEGLLWRTSVETRKISVLRCMDDLRSDVFGGSVGKICLGKSDSAGGWSFGVLGECNSKFRTCSSRLWNNNSGFGGEIAKVEKYAPRILSYFWIVEYIRG